MDELHRRLADIAHGGAISPDAMRNLQLASLAGADAVLAAPDLRSGGGLVRPTPLYHALMADIKRRRPILLVLDTLADLFGGDENVRAQARAFISLLRRPALQFGTTVVLLAHPSLSGLSSGTGTSGSTAWNNSVRSRLYLERPKCGIGDADARILRTMKSNRAPIGGEISLRWCAGVFAIPEDGGAPISVTMMAAQARADEIFLRMLATYTAEGRNVSVAGPNSAPALFASDARSEGITKLGLKEAMNRLFDANRVRVVTFGRASKTRNRLEAVSEGASK